MAEDSIDWSTFVDFADRRILAKLAPNLRGLGDWTLPRAPDLVIAPNGSAYLYRWHLIPRNDDANVYLHLQVQDDPERPLHDHPYDNQSVILAGGYAETYQDPSYPIWDPVVRFVRAGDVVHRKAEEAHRLRLLPGHRYAITLFTTGPRRREWGFWLESGWVPWQSVTEGDYREGGVSKWKETARER